LTGSLLFDNSSKLLNNFIYKGNPDMGSMDEQILRAAKEIVVKFIEGGRLSPGGFHETFKDIYHTIEETVKRSAAISQPAEEKPSAKPAKAKK
jgi:hypothetical protein